MSKTIELAKHLEKLHINNMYKSDFYWTWDKTDEELEAIFTVADALRTCGSGTSPPGSLTPAWASPSSGTTPPAPGSPSPPPATCWV